MRWGNAKVDGHIFAALTRCASPAAIVVLRPAQARASVLAELVKKPAGSVAAENCAAEGRVQRLRQPGQTGITATFAGFSEPMPAAFSSTRLQISAQMLEPRDKDCPTQYLRPLSVESPDRLLPPWKDDSSDLPCRRWGALLGGGS